MNICSSETFTNISAQLYDNAVGSTNNIHKTLIKKIVNRIH